MNVLDDAAIIDDAMRELLASLAGQPNNSEATDTPPAASSNIINWNLFEGTQDTDLDLSPEQEAVSRIAQGILERFDEVLDNSEDEDAERTDDDEQSIQEPIVSGKYSIPI